MKAKYKKLLVAIYEMPPKSNIQWKQVESLLEQFGAELSEGSDSRVRVALNGVRAVFHRPHPQKEMDKGAVKSLQRFLSEAGIKL